MASPTNSYTILTIPDVILRLVTHEEKGSLSLQSMEASLETEAQGADDKSRNPNRSVYLVLHLNGHAFPLDPIIPINLIIHQDGKRVYSFAANDNAGNATPVSLTLPSLAESKDSPETVSGDIETFDHILTQYADFRWEYEGSTSSESPSPLIPSATISAPPSYETAEAASDSTKVQEGKHVDNPELRGHLVLMDESSGEVLGQVPTNTTAIKEDPSVSGLSPIGGQDAGPVVLELPPEVYDAYTGAKPLTDITPDLLEAREIFVRAVPPEEQDWVTKSAHLVSQAISGSTSLLATGFTAASKYYISHSKPYTPPQSPVSGSGATSPRSAPTPTPTSPTPHPYLSKAHAWSGQAAKASARTADLVEGIIKRAVGNKNVKPTAAPTPQAQAQAPPVPVRDYKVYTPKSRTPIPNPIGPPPSLPPRNLNVSEKGVSTGSGASSPVSSTSPPPTDEKRKPLKIYHKVAIGANLVLATIDDSATRLFESGSQNLTAVVGHKYGTQAGHNTHLSTQTAKNVVLVYIDMSGFARRALIKKAGKEWIKARVSSSKG